MERRLQKDGKTLVWVSLHDLMNARLEMEKTPKLNVNGKRYSINMATSIALAFEIKYLKEHAESPKNKM